MNKDEFKVKLAQFLMEYKEQTINADLVKNFFSDMELTDEQLAMIMEYAGEKQEESHLSEEAAACVTAYLKDVEAVDLDLAGKKELFAAFQRGENQAVATLHSAYAKMVAEEASRFYRQQLSMEDLLQDASMGLLSGLAQAAESENPDEILRQFIRNELQNSVDSHSSFEESDRKLVSKVKELDEALTKLEKDLGRKVFPEEIAAEMDITEEEVREIIKLTGEELDDAE